MDFDPQSLDGLDHLAGGIFIDANVQADRLSDRVVCGFFEFASLQRVHGDAALRHSFLQDLNDGVKLPLVIGQDRQGLVLLVEFDRGPRSFEVVTHGDLMLRLDHGVMHLRMVDLTDDVKRIRIGHGWETPLRLSQEISMTIEISIIVRRMNSSKIQSFVARGYVAFGRSMGRNAPGDASMTRMFLTLATASLLMLTPIPKVNAADAPKLEGDWAGSLKITDAVSLRLIYHIKTEAGGSYSATIDSPDQGAKGLKVDSVKYQDGTVTLTSKGILAEYVGKVQADGKSIEGKFTQGGKATDMKLAPAEAEAKPDMIWEGKLNAGVELRVILNIFKQKDGTLKATFDSPDQGVQGMKVDSVTIENDKLDFKIGLIKGQYTGKFNDAKTEIEGTWSQGPGKLPLNFKKTDKVSEIKRPQVPKGPFPYQEIQVTYDNKEAKNTLAGTLTLPKRDGPFPVVILITGSGAQDRDETLLGHKPFLILADYLTRRGVGVLRVDDRSVGGSTGDHAKANSADFATDVQAGIDYLKTRKDIDAKKIGLMGHSEGGLIAPMVAVKSPADVAFIVLLAGPGVPGDEILAEQSALIQKAMGVDSEQIAKSSISAKKMYSLIRNEKDEAALKKGLDEVLEDIVKNLSEEDRKTLGVNPKAALETQIKLVQSPWFRYFLTYDPRPTLAKVKCPVLAINGEKDLQVPPNQNLPEIAKALKTGGNDKVTIKELPGLNHLFQTCKTGSPTEYATIEETFSPTALQIVGDWIVKVNLK